jgi:ligand-binding sensor domain-containing protein/signal transduction histidine kinase
MNAPWLFRGPRAGTSSVLVLVLILCLAGSNGFAQRKSIKQYVHDIWNTDRGLPQNSASDMLQTRDGYLWLATQEGLARFDGVEFTVFDRANTPAISNSNIVQLLEDSDGALWIRPAGQTPPLVRYAGGTFEAFDTGDGLANLRSNSWIADPTGGIWVGTLGGLARFKDGAFKTYTSHDGLPSDTVFAVSLDSRNTLWISTRRGFARMVNGSIERLSGRPEFPDTLVPRINRFQNTFEDSRGIVWMVGVNHLITYDQKTFTRVAMPAELRDAAINRVHEDRKGTIWFATDRGLVRYADGTFTRLPASKDPDENDILEIHEDKESSLWLATGKGIARLAHGAFEHYQSSHGLSDDAVQRILIDKEANIWVSTFGGGIDRFRDEKFVTYSSKVGLSYDNVVSVLEDRSGAMWVGTSFGGVNRIRDGKVTVIGTRDGLPSSEVGALAEDREGRIWIGTARGVVTYQNGVVTPRFTMQDNQPVPVGDAILARPSGDVLVSSNNAVLTYRNGRYSHLVTPDSARNINANITGMYEDRRGTLWICTRSSLYWYRDGKVTKMSGRDGFPERWHMSFYEDPDGVIWLGASDHGLVRFKDGVARTISPKEGLFDYSAYVILEDTSGYLWMSSNKGVYRVLKSELNAVADGKAARVTSVAYGRSDGMETFETNGGVVPAGWRFRDGRLAFATLKGVAVVNPADIRINQVPPPVVIDRFVVEGEKKDSRLHLTIPPGNSRFEFHYAGISFAGAKDVRYKYQLVGMDEDWVDAGSRRGAYYTHLDPGEYTFRVKAANSDGIWNEDGASVSFTLEPRFYQTAWFLGITLFAFLTTGPSFYFYRMRAMKKRREELERTVRERTAELQKTVSDLKETQNQLILSEKMASLGQLTAGIAHEIKNPLNFITNFAVLSQDLTQDLRQELHAERERVDPARAKEISGLLDVLQQNVTKINEHGKRADSIVRGMLLHSRGKAGERQETDLNALLAEYTNLAYHGMRAQDQSFNVKIETDFDPAVGKVNVVPQDLSRAFLNIVNNACYAAFDKRRSAANGFMPTVRVSARSLPGGVEIRIRDNGNGIPQTIRDKIFNPFFTTKPAGAGTGLGLSLSYDIITQVHKGTIAIDTREGEFTEFIITLPRGAGKDERTAA